MTELADNKKALLKKAIIVISVVMTIFQFYTAAVKPFASMYQRPIHYAFMLLLLFLYRAMDQKNRILRICDYLLAILGVVGNMYIMFNYNDIQRRSTNMLTMDIAISIFIIAITLYGTWRSVSVWMMAVGAAFLVYSGTGQYLTGVFHFGGLSLNRALSNIVMSSDGLYGSTLAVSATYVFMFVLLGEFLLEYGAGKFIIDLAYSVFGRFRGGSIKVAIFASGLFGMVSGSGTANVMGTGTFTIPLIKSRGYSPEYAGATEAAASTGGLIMPPVMGAAAFIMAEYLGIPYSQLCLYAIIPAIFFFISLFFVADLHSVRIADFGTKSDDLPKLKDVVAEGWHHAICIGVLIYFLCIVRYSASKSCVYSIVALLICDYARRLVTKDKIKIVTELKRLVAICQNAAKGCITIALACACAGIIVGVFSATGLNLRLSGILIQLAGGNLLLLLILAMIGGLILGMGMPSVSVYILLAIMIAPALIKMNVSTVSAHMFLFYFGILAPITPPVGICFYAAATIAKSNPMKTGFTSWRMALPGFILPFLFVYDEAIMGIGSPAQVVWTCFYAFVGLLAMASVFEGNLWYRQMNIVIRVLMMVFSIMTVVPEMRSTIIGLIGIAACGALTLLKGKKFDFEAMPEKVVESVETSAQTN